MIFSSLKKNNKILDFRKKISWIFIWSKDWLYYKNNRSTHIHAEKSEKNHKVNSNKEENLSMTSIFVQYKYKWSSCYRDQ